MIEKQRIVPCYEVNELVTAIKAQTGLTGPGDKPISYMQMKPSRYWAEFAMTFT